MPDQTQDETKRFTTLLQNAVVSHRAGEFVRAETLYRQVLEKFPNHPDVLNLHGVLLHQRGRNNEALAFLERACHLDPENAGFLNHLGACRRALGRIESAREAFAQARTLQPDLAEAALNLASVLSQLSHHGDAELSALDAIRLAPTNIDARLALAVALKDQGRHRDTLEVLLETRRVCAPDIRVLVAIAQNLVMLGQTDAASKAARRAVLFAPQAPTSYVFLDEAKNAAQWARQAVILAPGDARMWLNLSNRHVELNDNQRAGATAKRGMTLSPGTASHYINMSISAMRTFDLDLARRVSYRGLWIDPEQHVLAILASECERSRGNIWKGLVLYERRMFLNEAYPRLDLPPAWDRAAPPQGPLLVCAEQGVGDEFIFMSCLPDLLQIADDVTVECDARCIPLFQRSFPDARWIPRTLREIRPGTHAWDYSFSKTVPAPAAHIMMASLPGMFHAGMGRPATRGGYLRVDPGEAIAWRDWLTSLPDAPKVGVSWRSGVVDHLHADYYFTPEQLLDAIGPASATFVSLLYADVTEDIERIRNTHDIVVHEPPGLFQRDELDRLAALISQLDLVVTADTSVCAMAAACGVKTIRLEASYMLLSNGRDALFENLYPCRDTETPFQRDAILARAGDKFRELIRELNAA